MTFMDHGSSHNPMDFMPKCLVIYLKLNDWIWLKVKKLSDRITEFRLYIFYNLTIVIVVISYQQKYYSEKGNIHKGIKIPLYFPRSPGKQNNLSGLRAPLTSLVSCSFICADKKYAFFISARQYGLCSLK